MSNYKKRLIYFINPKFQTRVLLFSVCFTLTILLIIFSFHNYYFQHLISVGKQLKLQAGHPYFTLLEEQRMSFQKYFLIMSSVIVVFTLTVSTYFSHKIAGPLYRIRKYFEDELASKDVPARIRKNDFFQDLPVAINDFFNKGK